MDHSSPCSSHDAAGYSSLLLLLVEAEVTKQSSNGPDNFYPVGEDLVLFNLGTSIGAANCNVNESGKSHTGKRKEVDLPLFSFASVSAATDNFSNANKLGKGGFGPVYKIQ